jgi:hypothetical protein
MHGKKLLPSMKALPPQKHPALGAEGQASLPGQPACDTADPPKTPNQVGIASALRLYKVLYQWRIWLSALLWPYANLAVCIT